MTAFLTLLRRMNLRHFLRRRLRTLLTLAGVAAGVMLVFSIGVLNASLVETVRSSIRNLAGAAEIEVSTLNRNGFPVSTTSEISQIDGVERAVPVLRSMSDVRGETEASRTMILGVTPDFANLFPREATELTRVEVEGGFGIGSGVLLSQTAMDRIGAGPGSEVIVTTPRGEIPVPVTGRVGGPGTDLLNGGQFGVMLLPAAQDLFSRRGQIDSVYVILEESASAQDVQSRIEDAVGSKAVVGPPGERGDAFNDTVASVTTLTSLAATVALLVSVFVVFNTMAMSLAERRREISMCLALGATPRQMFAAFLAEAAVLGTVASVAGVAAGYGLARFLVDRVLDAFPVLPVSAANPVAVPAVLVIAAIVGGLLVSLTGAFIPARRVMSVVPVEALRPDTSYEWAGQHKLLSLSLIFLLAIGALGASVITVLLYVFVFREATWLVNVSLALGLLGITALLLRVVPFAVRILRMPFTALFKTPARLAVDALEKNPSRTTFTVAALTLTLGMVIGVGTALGSYESELERSAGQWLGADLYVTANSYLPLGSDQPLKPEIQDDIAAVAGVRGVYPVRYAFLELGREQAMIYAVPAARAAREGFEAITAVGGVEQSEMLRQVAAGSVFIARYTAEQQGWDEGDTISLPTPQGAKRFVVGGVFDDLNSFQSMFVEHEIYAKYWQDDKIDRFGIIVDEGVSPAEVKGRIADVIEREGIPADVLSRRESVGQLVDTVDGLFSMARAIQLAALVVALLTIANTMFTAVLERRWEMGLQRALGMTKRHIFRTLVLETTVIGSIGGAGAIAMGTATGYFMTQLMEAQYAWRIPYQAPATLILLSVLSGLGIALLAGLLPARLAVRVPIIESLRYE